MSFISRARAIISGTASLAKDLVARNTGELAVEIGGSNAGPFGQIRTYEPTQVFSATGVYGLNAQVVTSSTVTSGSVDTNASRYRLQSGFTSGASAILQSVRPIAYRAGLGNEVLFTPVFTTGIASSTQIAGVGNAVDGYFVGYNGTAFGILHRNNSVDAWTARTAWNGDRCDGTAGANNPSGLTWDPTKGLPVLIVYPYLGYGNIRFYVQNPADSSLILFHTIKYSNFSASVEVTNPSLFFYAQVLSTGSTTNLTLYIGSAGAFLSGQRVFTGPQGAADKFKSGVTAETVLLSLRNCTTYNTVTNRGIIRIRSIAFAADGGNSVSIMRIRRGATVGGVPAFSPYNGTTGDNGVTITSGQSMVSVDVAGTTATGGTLLGPPIAVARNAGNLLDVTTMDIFILPGETLTFSAFCDLSATAIAGVSWQEDH